jgi:hypothetical protein
MWPLARAVADAAEPVTGRDVAAFARWIEEHRFDGAPGGREEFLATPRSRVAVFVSLLRRFFEAEVFALAAPRAEELELAFDPCAPLPAPEAFLAEARWGRVRRALRSALERTTGHFERGFDQRLAGGAASRSTTWGEVHLLTLTPHQRRTSDGATFDDALASLLRPARVSADTPFHRAQEARVIPIGGTEDTLFQFHASTADDIERALHATPDGTLYLLPVDFGSQILWTVRLAPGERPRARFLALLGSTEITRAIPGSAIGEGDHFRTTDDFARGVWNDLGLERLVLERDARAILDLRLERDPATGRLGLPAAR